MGMDRRELFDIITSEDREFDDCPACGSAHATLVSSIDGYVCNNPDCQNYDAQYSDFVDMQSWWKFEFPILGLDKSKLEDAFNSILRTGSKVIDDHSGLGGEDYVKKFTIVSPSKKIAQDLSAYIDNLDPVMANLRTPDTYEIVRATPQEQQLPDISDEIIKDYVYAEREAEWEAEEARCGRAW